MSSKLIEKIQTISNSIETFIFIVLAAIGTFFLLTRKRKNNTKVRINFAELEAREQAREQHEKVKKNGGNSIDNDIADMVE